MTTYTWAYGASGSGTYFQIEYNDETGKFTVTAFEGSVNIDALWFSDANKTSDGYTLTKSDSSLNLNGATTVWADDGTSTTQKFVWDDYLKDSLATVVTAGGPSQTITAPADFDPETYSVLGVRATTSAGTVKWVDALPQVDEAPTLTVDAATVTLAYDAAAGTVTGADADATDPEGSAATYSLVGTIPADAQGNPLFSIGSDGQISLTTEGAAYIGTIGSFKSYEVTVQASDGALSSNTATITIQVAPPTGKVLVFNAAGEFVSGHDTIQAAINAAGTGFTVMVSAGTYNEAVNVNKAVTLLGANAGIDGDGMRSAETIITGKVTINSASTLDGFKFVNTTNNTTAYDAVQVQTSGDVVIENNVFYSNGANGSNGTIDRAVYITTAATGSVTVDDNLITGAQTTSFGDANWTSAVWSDGNSSDLVISDNTFEYVRTAINLDGYVSEKVTVTENTIENAGSGISIGVNTPETTVTFEGITDNTFETVGTDFNLQNIGSTKSVSFDIAASGNVATTDQTMTILGGSGGDTISGTSGTDFITGNAGSDLLTGAGGSDRFIFNRALSGTNIDTITDFTTDDTIALDDAIFTALSNANLATDFGTKILYDSTTGALSYDADGAGGNAAVRFATVSPDLALTASDFLIV